MDDFYLANPATDSEHLRMLSNQLEGTTVLPKPRVSKKIMVSAIKGQNKIMQDLLKDMEDTKRQMSLLTDRSNFLQERVEILESRSHSQSEHIRQQDDLISRLESTVELFRSKVDLFDDINKRFKETEASVMLVKEIMLKQNSVNSRFEESMEADKKLREALTARLNKVDKDIKNLPTTLTLGAQQIIVEALTKRPGSREIRLNEWTNTIKQTVDLHDYDIATLKKEVSRHEDDIQLRAHIEFESKVNEQLELVRMMKEKLDSQDSVDLVDLRKNVNTCLESVDEIRLDLMMKINAADVDEKIEERYEDIVDHLMKALKNVQDDEDDFKKATDDLHAALDSIKTSKADRGELDFVKQRIQKMSEDSGKTDPELMDTIQKRLTKEEIQELLEDKVDKEDLTRAIDDLTKTLNQYSYKVSKFRPMVDRPHVGRSNTLKIHNLDTKMLVQIPGGALAVTESLTTKNRPQNIPGFKTCLACHTVIPNLPREKLFTGASYGGGFQIFVPGGGIRGPPLRTGPPATTADHVTSLPPGSLSPQREQQQSSKTTKFSKVDGADDPASPGIEVVSL